MKLSAIYVENLQGHERNTVLVRSKTPADCLQKTAKAIIAFYQKHDKKDEFKTTYRIGEVEDTHSPHPSLVIYRTEGRPFGPNCPSVDDEPVEQELNRLTYNEIWNVGTVKKRHSDTKWKRLTHRL